MMSLQYILVVLGIYTTAFAQEIGEDCRVTSTGKLGKCKILADCPLVEEQARAGISPTICGFYRHSHTIVCCENNYNQLRPRQNTFLTNEDSEDAFVYPDSIPVSSNNIIRKSEQKCNEYSNSTVDVIQAIPLIPHTEPISISVVKCDFNGVPLIVGGSPASAGEFPFMAAIGFPVNDEIQWRCGGTLISDQYILTAAHCATSRDAGAPTVVRLGDLDLVKTDDGSEYVDYAIQRIVVHPQYRYPQKYNDIALVRLRQSVTFTKFIRPACLYSKNHTPQTKAIATGWGKTDYLAADTNNRLLKVVLNIYDNTECSETYKRNKNLPDGIRSNMLCAGELKGGRDTCQGDSGGPLIVTKEDNNCKFYVVGVTSFGKYCGAANIPAVYTRVSSYISWIEDTIW